MERRRENEREAMEGGGGGSGNNEITEFKGHTVFLFCIATVESSSKTSITKPLYENVSQIWEDTKDT